MIDSIQQGTINISFMKQASTILQIRPPYHFITKPHYLVMLVGAFQLLIL